MLKNKTSASTPMVLNMIRKISFSLYNGIMQRNSNFLFRNILKTPAIKTNPNAETTLYCALNKANCRAYILVAKSFLRYYSNVSVMVQNDGTMDEKCISEIQSHIKGVTIYSKAEMMNIIAEHASPQLLKLIPDVNEYQVHTSIKIMYLKFLNVIFRLNGKKVIIIDSDLLFLKHPNAIIEWIEKPYNHDFYGEGSNANAKSYYKIGFEFKSLDIANFSSGTIGIGGTVNQDELIDIFSRIQKYNPSLFLSWELEQALWAIVMAKRENPLNLDELREIYIGSGWRPYDELREKAVIVHFAGAFRFKNLRYLRLAHDIIQVINRFGYKAEHG